MTNTTIFTPRFDEMIEHPDDARTGFSYFTPLGPVMNDLVDELFVRNWQRIVVGPVLEGTVFEICFKSPPEVRILDGYLTVDLGTWHFHLCISKHKGSSSEELRRMRPAAKIAFFDFEAAANLPFPSQV